MTQEEKNLLLCDLCGRLPYGVKIRLGDYDYQVCGYNSEKEMPLKIWYYYNSNLKSYIDVYLTDYRPYLRPLSSITEEEKKSLPFPWVYNFGEITSYTESEGFLETTHTDCLRLIDYLNKNMFDYRELIPKGLALSTDKFNPYKD